MSPALGNSLPTVLIWSTISAVKRDLVPLCVLRLAHYGLLQRYELVGLLLE